MTVQILSANDDNAPKLQLIPRFKLTPGRKRYFKIVAILTVILGLASGFYYKGSFFTSFMSAVVVMLMIQAVVFYFWFMAFNAKLRATNGTSANGQLHIHEYYKKVFQDNGYQVDYEAKGILIDNKNKKITSTAYQFYYPLSFCKNIMAKDFLLC
ncbi:hypothetical protein [Acinetobacter sp. c1-l78]|uniref:hypothetical protein n=1 Tax=Acinetobacter sp. c1-l78 TaxID=3342803 RepID=UPI0035B99A57